MKHVITSNDTSINIKYIDVEESHYQLNIPNNDINKKLIENTVFKFEKSGTQTIIMYDDVHVFQLSKIECNYSEFIEMKKQLENTEKEVILLKQELSKNEKEMVNFKNDLLQQIEKVNDKSREKEIVQLKNEEHFLSNKILSDKKEIDTINSKLNNTDSLLQKQNNYYLPFVFIVGLEYVTHYGNKQIVTFNDENNKEWIGFFNSQKDVKLIPKITNIRLFHTYAYIIIPPEKVLISISGGQYSLKVYNKGIHYNIHTGNLIMLINEKNIDNIIALYKKEQTIQIFGILNITYIESECLQE